MKTLITAFVAIVTITATLGFPVPAAAGGYYGNHNRGHYGYGNRGHHYGYRRHYGHHGYGYLAAGLVLGAAFSNSRYQRPYVQRRTVVYRQPVYASPPRYTQPDPVVPQAAPAPVARPDYYLRKDRNGECWLVESTEDGDQIITPQSPDVCG